MVGGGGAAAKHAGEGIRARIYDIPVDRDRRIAREASRAPSAVFIGFPLTLPSAMLLTSLL